MKTSAKGVFAGLAALGLLGSHCAAARPRTPQAKPLVSLGGALLLADEGSFFVGGHVERSEYPSVPGAAGRFVVGQMYVHYRVPLKRRHRWPIVMVHGGGLTGATYETTPDGREGWATYFARRGFVVYVVDLPGRGRAGFDPTAINRAAVEKNASSLPGLIRRTEEYAWTVYRFGPANGVPYPGIQYPTEAAEALSAQSVPTAEVFLPDGLTGAAPNALAALLDKIGPAVVMAHSQSGPFADKLVELRPLLVRAVINIEASQGTIPTDAQIAAYRDVPDLELFGDNVIGNPTATGQSRYDGRKSVVSRIKAAGYDADIVALPDIGLHGNSHLLMQDRNNLEVANFLIRWIERIVEPK